MRHSKAIVAALVLGLGALGVVPAQAAVSPQLADKSFQALGLIVKYKDGVSAVAADGQPTAENAAGANLNLGRDLGQGWRSVNFDSQLAAGDATAIALRMASDPRVASVELNRKIEPASIAAPFDKAAYDAMTPASPVRSVQAADVWSQVNPSQAAVKLSWAAPASLAGAMVAGYRIEQNDSSGWKLATVSSSPVTNITIKQGLKGGISYSFRVAAITKAGSVSKVGQFSTAVKVMPTSTPQPPVFNGANTAFADSSPSWAKQSLAQSGGLPILGYTATASATGQPSVTCNAPASATTCKFVGLAPNITYTVTLQAKNAHGVTSSLPSVTPLDAFYNKQWSLWSTYGINAPSAWSRTMGSKSVVVAVIDSGITSHPDLNDQIVPGYDFVSDVASSGDGDGWDPDPTDPGDYSGNQPSSWHGTHVAGLIAAESNSIGVTGVAPNVKIEPIRALGSSGGSSADLIAALHWAAGIHVAGVPDNKNPAKVVNLSMGTDSSTPCRLPGETLGATEQALADLKNAGITVISAAGNYNVPAYMSYPGNCYPTINVGATGFSGDRASYSNYSVLDNTGTMVGVDISAPGGDSQNPGNAPDGTNGKIISTLNTGKTTVGSPTYDYDEGTSMATPLVTGVVALLYSLNSKLTFDQVWKLLQSTVTPFPPGSECAKKGICGAGIVNAGAAVAAAAAQP